MQLLILIAFILKNLYVDKVGLKDFPLKKYVVIKKWKNIIINWNKNSNFVFNDNISIKDKAKLIESFIDKL